MAQLITVNSEYNGKAAGEIFLQAFKEVDTIKKNAITVLPNNTGTGYLPQLSYDAELQKYACGFDTDGNLTYNDKEVTLRKYMLNNELCKNDFQQTFSAQTNGFGAARDIPATIQESILLGIIDNVGAKVDKAIWQGDGLTAPNNIGLIAQMEADAAVEKITAVATTSANVVDQLEAAYALVIDEVAEDEDLVMAVSTNVARAYKQAQVNMGLNTTVGDKELDYLGVRMESIGGLPANTIAIYRVKNLGFLTGLESDLNEVRVVDMDATTLNGMVRTQVLFEMGLGYSFGEEIVLSRTV